MARIAFSCQHFVKTRTVEIALYSQTIFAYSTERMIKLDPAKLKNLREARKMTLKDVAFATSMSESRISNYENGIREPSAGTLMVLLDFYRVTQHEVSTDEPVGVA